MIKYSKHKMLRCTLKHTHTHGLPYMQSCYLTLSIKTADVTDPPLGGGYFFLWGFAISLDACFHQWVSDHWVWQVLPAPVLRSHRYKSICTLSIFFYFFPLRFVLVDTDLGFFHGSFRVFVGEVCVFPRVFPRVDVKMAKTSSARQPNPRRRSSNTSVKV